MILSLKMALRSISANKLRAALTMLGIIIGVMALVVLVSLVNGATSSVTDAVSSLANDLLTVTISDDKGDPVRLDDLDAWAKENGSIGSMAPSASASVTGKYGADSGSFTVYGTTAAYYDIEGLQLTMGRFLNRADVENNTRVCVLNYAAAEDLIGFVDCIGEELSLNGVKYTVVGVLSEDENLMSSMMGGSYVAYIPYTSLMRLSTTVSEAVTQFVLSAGEGATIEQAEEAVSDILYERFQEDEDAYSLSSMDVMEDAMSSISSILSILLGGIAGISLIVGGIGIMNIMLVTVTGTVVLIAVLFCFFIGVVFGLYPANKAAKMKPIDALHYGG